MEPVFPRVRGNRRKYLLAYWRYLLGWEPAPEPTDYKITWIDAFSLRLMAKNEILGRTKPKTHEVIQFKPKEPDAPHPKKPKG